MKHFLLISFAMCSCAFAQSQPRTGTPTKIQSGAAVVSVEGGDSVTITPATGGAVNVTGSGQVYVPTILDFSTDLSTTVSAPGHYLFRFNGTSLQYSNNSSALASLVGSVSTTGTVSGITLSATNSSNAVTLTLGGAITGFATTAGNLSQFAATTSAQLLGVISDETGTGLVVSNTNAAVTAMTITSGTLAGTTVNTGAITGGTTSPVLLTATNARAANGSAGTPSIAFTSATDTGFFYETTTYSKIAWSQGGTLGGVFDSGGMYMKSTGSIAFLASDSVGAIGDTKLFRDAAYTVALRNSTNAQRFNIGNTFTSTSVREDLSLYNSSNVGHIGMTTTGATARVLQLDYGGTTTAAISIPITSGAVTFGGGAILNAPARLKGYTVATLPAGTQGDVAFVTDALAPAFLATVVGGGAIVTEVFYNGSAWQAQ